MNEKKLLKFIVALTIIILGVVAYLIFTRSVSSPARTITSFEECMKAGYPVAESHPRQCRTPDSKNFVEDLTPNSKTVTVSGEIACLPKTGSGNQTLECATGLKGADGKYYGLKNVSKHDPEYRFSMTGMKVEVTGALTSGATKGPGESVYDTVGTIDVTSIKEMK